MKIDMKLFDMSAEIKRKLGKAFKEAVTPGQTDENRWPPGRRATGRIVKNKPRWFPDRDYGIIQNFKYGEKKNEKRSIFNLFQNFSVLSSKRSRIYRRYIFLEKKLP